MNPCLHCAGSGFVRVMPQACSPHVMPQACSPHDDGGLDACPRCARVAEAEFAFAALTARPTPQPRRPQGRQPRPHTSHRERTAA